jgi:diaminopimelate decarboxylase
MQCYHYRDGQLVVEDLPLAEIAAQVGTPFYVYSRAFIEARWHAFDQAFGGRAHRVCYAVKANSNLAVLQLLARLGSGFDIVSVGELERVLAAGGQPGQVVFSGVGKGVHEIERALEVGIDCFNVESEAELVQLNEVAGRTGRRAAVSLRVNPDVDAKTHPYISTGLKENKFGIAMAQARAAYHVARALPHLRVTGVDCHIGSQLTELRPFTDALERVLVLVDQLAADGIGLQHLDLGGGLGIRYRDERPPEPGEYVATVLKALDAHGDRYRGLKLLIEPGRAIVGNAGLLVTRIHYLKHSDAKNFAIVDAAMNDLMRPALYDAWQDIVPLRPRAGATQTYDVVGPVCESGDFLGRDRALDVHAGDLLAVCSAGAYGSSMSSNYNTRPRAPEVLVDGRRFHVVRRRETVEELLMPESLLPDGP